MFNQHNGTDSTRVKQCLSQWEGESTLQSRCSSWLSMQGNSMYCTDCIAFITVHILGSLIPPSCHKRNQKKCRWSWRSVTQVLHIPYCRWANKWPEGFYIQQSKNIYMKAIHGTCIIHNLQDTDNAFFSQSWKYMVGFHHEKWI